jgi:hypothetical protein
MVRGPYLQSAPDLSRAGGPDHFHNHPVTSPVVVERPEVLADGLGPVEETLEALGEGVQLLLTSRAYLAALVANVAAEYKPP